MRNARDWAKEKREKLMAAANSKMQDADHSDVGSSTQSFVSLSSNAPAQLGSETSADELGLGLDTIAGFSRRTPVAARTNPPPKVPSKRRVKEKTVRDNMRFGTRRSNRHSS